MNLILLKAYFQIFAHCLQDALVKSLFHARLFLLLRMSQLNTIHEMYLLRQLLLRVSKLNALHEMCLLRKLIFLLLLSYMLESLKEFWLGDLA